MSKSKKKDYWADVGNGEGFLAAVGQLGADYKQLDAKGEGCQKSDGVWGRLAEFAKLDNKATYDARQWLYTMWKGDQRKVRTTFLSIQVTDVLPDGSHESSDNITNKASQNSDKVELCPVTVDINIASEPKQKGDPSVFKVVIVGEKNHNPKQQKVGRPITGPLREAIAKEVKTIGALGVYERNLRHANEELLKEGNFSEVPTKEVLDKIKQEYDNKYRLDENCYKERYCNLKLYKRLFLQFLGFIQTIGEWPFTVHFFTEIQIDRFVKYCRSDKYSCLHIDATGSVVRSLKDQKDVFFYCLVYRHDDSSILPLTGALLTDHTAASITSYFLSVRSKLLLRSKIARPAFVVIDFSAALINSVLASFNVENIHTYLRRCYNTINSMYKTKQLRNMTFLRLCCSHAMKAFSRGLFKINVSKEAHHHLMTFFAILLNSTNIAGIFDLYRCIIHIYGDPYCDTPYTTLASLLNKSELDGFDVEPYLEECNVQDDKELKQDFLDETDITTDAIIRQSPFNIKARADIPALSRFFERKKLDEEPRNQLYSAKVVHLLHKWFAYIPLWSGILVGFYERYAKDKKAVSTNQWQFGYGRVSNASIETYFRTIKSSVLEHHTTLRPNEFLMRIHNHVIARMKGDQFGVAPASHGRRKKKDEADDLNILDKWKRRQKKNPKGSKQTSHFNDNVSKMIACKIADSDSDKSRNSFNDCSIGFSVFSSQMPCIVDVISCDPETNSPSTSPIKIDAPPITNSSSSDNIFLALSAITNSHLSRAFCSKRLHSSSNSDRSTSTEQLMKQPCPKKTST
ncbi:unnamed protein product [Adineta ricciae]|uniref:Uncharacterized protein n=1 Tax=Adineta ricciae TaxID=249248 RepID=A0A815L1K1_ADIRI|nr:unnamed protein product [Adineta ricciae]